MEFDFYCVTDAPRLTAVLRDQRVVDGGIASFLCRASGNPVPEVYWRRAGRRVSVGQRYTVVAVPLGGSLLRIEPVKAARDDDTAVECVAENGVGEPVSATARLHVYRDGLGSPYTPRLSLPPPRRICFRRCLFVCLFVCWQLFARTSERIYMKF